MRATLLVCTALTAQALPASAQDWNGNTSTDWFDGTNWSGNAVPGAGANAVIDNTNPGGQGVFIAGSITDNLTNITIGSSGNGKLTIASAGGLTAGDGSAGSGAGFVGYNLGSTGSVLMDCGCTTWHTDGGTFVGYGGSGTFTVNGGAVTNLGTSVGTFAGANGAIVVDGAGSSWTTSASSGPPIDGQIIVGDAGAGTFTVRNGGTVNTVDTYLGLTGRAVGTATVTGSGSSWTGSGNMYVGSGATGTFNVSDGGQVVIDGSYGGGGTQGLTVVGYGEGANGTINVSTGGSWLSAIGIVVGGNIVPGLPGGTGTFNLLSGGTVSTAETDLGVSTGSSGTVNVSDAGSVWTTGFTTVGVLTTGTYNVTNGGEVHVTVDAYLGLNPGSVGTVNVSGVSSGLIHSTWTNDGALVVGEQGTGVLNVQSGGVVNANGPLIIGDCSCSIGTVTVTGAGSQFNSTATGPTDVSIGYGGAGTFNVTNGASATFATDVYLGVFTGSTGTVTVSGGGSTWTSSGAVIVGSDGTGTFTVANGGTVSSGVLVVGAAPGSTGTVTVTGAGSSWTTNSTLTAIGFGGTGTLNVLNGATASLGGISVGAFGGTGTLRVDATSQVTGNGYSQGPTGTYRVGLNQATNGRVTLTGGDIDLTGGGALVVDAKTTQARTYTIMSTDGGVFGTFDTVTVNGNANNLQVQYNVCSLGICAITLSVDAFSVASLLPAGVTGNAKNLATGIDHAILAGANLPDPFFDVFNLTGANLVNALNQLSGETATGGVQAGTQMMNSFLSLLLNPFGGAPGGNPGALGFARDFGAGDKAQTPEAALAYAAVTPKDKRVDPFGQRWGIWGAAYGGYNKNSGDAATGSHDTTARAYGLATGYDYRVSGDTTVGFALAGGGASWGLSSSLGTGRSDVLQLGAYATQKFGAAYVSAALSYAWHSVNTDRTVTVSGADHLTASFNAHSIGGRLETGYRYLTPFAGITPYASLQVQDFITPSYGETAISGSNAFALAYGARSTIATRTELGAWFDKTMVVKNGDVLTLRTRAAWANDHSGNQGVAAAFQTLPGSSFTVNGATPATNLALLSAGAELRMAENVSLGVKLDGEFAARSQTYAATGTVRYGW